MLFLSVCSRARTWGRAAQTWRYCITQARPHLPNSPDLIHTDREHSEDTVTKGDDPGARRTSYISSGHCPAPGDSAADP